MVIAPAIAPCRTIPVSVPPRLQTSRRRQPRPLTHPSATRLGVVLLLLFFASCGLVVRADRTPAFLRIPWMSSHLVASSHTRSSRLPEDHDFKTSRWTSMNAQEAPPSPSGRSSPSSSNLVTWGGGMLMKAMGAAGSNLATAEIMSLDSIRSTLIRQEETIIFSLIERAQFRKNKVIYERGVLQVAPTTEDYDFVKDLSFLEYVLLETEKVHAKVRRYTSPEEYAFFPKKLPDPILPRLVYPSLLAPNTVDASPHVLSMYINEIVPAICKKGDDEQHGSSVLCDINVLQAISKRVHLGKFVAETKFQENEEKYTRLVRAGDIDGVMELLTNREVEKRVLARAELKASTYGQDITGQTEERKVEPQVIAAIYRDFIIPLTKDVEVMYLFERVGLQPPRLPARPYTLNVGV